MRTCVVIDKEFKYSCIVYSREKLIFQQLKYLKLNLCIIIFCIFCCAFLKSKMLDREITNCNLVIKKI